MHRRALVPLVFALLWLPAVTGAKQYPPAFPRTGATKLIENDRVIVWDMTWEKGPPSPVHEHQYDMVAVFLADGQRRLIGPDGKATNPPLMPRGGVAFLPKGTVHAEQRIGDPAPHARLIELKPPTGKPTSSPLPAGMAPAFPRPGSRKIMENDRVVVWDYTWTPGEPTPMHFHDKDVVVTYLDNGSLQSTTPDGKRVVNDYTDGMTRFNARDRVHSETLIRGRQRAIIVELK